MPLVVCRLLFSWVRDCPWLLSVSPCWVTLLPKALMASALARSAEVTRRATMLHHSERPAPSLGSVRVTNRADTAPSGAVMRPEHA
ncbi:hypothetical protein D3C75_1189360 [compost metagenome]